MNEVIEKKQFLSVGEELYKFKLDNGMQVVIIPKLDYYETYGIVTANFGSVDTQFVDGKSHLQTYPAGVAHFLEHKLYEDVEGKDFLQKFAALGAESNAFTGFTRTSFLFSTSEEENVQACVDLLLEMVSSFTVTAESLESEREIIGQEIDMYKDQPDECLFYHTLANLYPNSPLADDIAGSRDSLSLIDKTVLLENFNHFYKSENLTLLLVGNIQLENLLSYFGKKSFPKKAIEKYAREELSYDLVIPTSNKRMDVSSPKLAIGIRGKDPVFPHERLRYKLLLKLLFSMLFGWTSSRFQSLYETGKIDYSLNMEVEVEENFHFVILTMDSEEPVSLSHTLRSALRNFEKDPDVTEEHLDIVKSDFFGDFLQGLNSLEYIATEYNPCLEGENLFDIPTIIQNIRLKDVLEVGRRFIEECDMVDHTIFPI